MLEIECLSCGQGFEDYQGLALHIMGNKKGHKKGKKWAAKYISRHVVNKKDNEFKGRTALTEEQKITKQNLWRPLSGDMRYVNTVCPKCLKLGRPLLETEYTSSSQAWIIEGRLAKMCNECEG